MRKGFSLILMVLGLLALAGLAPRANAAELAKVRVVHASPDAPAVDVWVDGNKVLTNVPFFTASDYLSLPAGAHNFVVTPTGQGADKAVINATATLEAGMAYTVAATGKVANIEATILTDNLAMPAAGKAHVRVVHASPDTPAVDVKVKGGPALISNLAFPKASQYLPVDAGTYDLIVTPAGTNTVALDLSGTRLEAGKIYDIFAVGLLNGQPALRVEVTTPTPVAPADAMPTGMPQTGAETLPVYAGILAALALLLAGSGLVLRRQGR